MPIPKFVDIYQGLISTSSISSTDPKWDQGNAQVIAKLATWFEDLGFVVTTEEVEPGKLNLMAQLGTGEGGLLLAGHTDTVPFDQGRWNFDPHQLTLSDNRYYGLGTADMKGFFAFILDAVKQMQQNGTDWGTQTKPLYILATCDEETTMLGAKHFTKDAPFKPDYCIIGEPTNLVPIRGHKGHMANAIRITGKSGHSSDPALGVNAIEIMHEVMYSLMQLKQRLIKDYHHPGFAIPNPTLNLGHIHGGDSPNRICGCCELHYDLRPLPGLSLESLDQLLQEHLQTVMQKWPGRIEVNPLHPPIPGYECHAEHHFVQDMQQLCETESQTVNYCTEAPFLQELCPTLVMGPGSIDQAHQPDEFLSLDFINPTINILQKSINQYCFTNSAE
ncbi:acetylornithine deacetylase [Vibrio ezurae]|uniref:Acetylornithine deacetylase n=1 Tax=Vibrio ezurae NBRC 102218 TaxID=1219080 RepID=U3CR39_9VIBR|nr:acetylornithine deacetylase [Vibrio ezurae]GAD80568.1 acetylornithine deacetylase [Vibrio ezurae NBRC 102218]